MPMGKLSLYLPEVEDGLLRTFLRPLLKTEVKSSSWKTEDLEDPVGGEVKAVFFMCNICLP